jgi:hypothetical protein
LVAAFAAAGPAHAAGLRAGAGRADITPQTGYYLGGWTRADRISHGQHTRLFARALVLDSGGRKVALVAVDLFMVPAGIVRQVGEALADRGLSEQNILISASHTHSGPGGYANFKTFNTAGPSLDSVMDPLSFYRLLDPKPADPQLYTFLVHQITAAVRRADDDLGPAKVAWGSAEIRGLTMNRSIEAHLADHGMQVERGRGSAAQDPEGVDDTIDPRVNVLRVDKLDGRRRVPIGGWSTFADHGTVTKSSFQFYNADHHASATRVFEAAVRRAGRVPRGQQVLNVYGNSDEGDQSAGLVRDGPAASDYVGRVEAAAMLRAWRSAGRRLTASPALDLRWTRVCFCGQRTSGGAVADYAMIGLPFLTGSEEERGPLFDITHVPLEATRNPLPVPGQGHKNGIPLQPSTVPKAVPLMAVRIGSRMIVSLPGEATAEVGSRVRGAVLAQVSGSGVRQVVVSGLADEYIQYLTTPEEYDRQHYEGGATLYGPLSSVFLGEQVAALAGRLAREEPAPAPYPFDPTNGIAPDGPAYGDGAAHGAIEEQPRGVYRRLGHVPLEWQGGPLGLDRPVDRAFVVVQRRAGRRWVRADSDLGLAMLWQVDDGGRYRAFWEIPRSARPGRYRMVVTAKRYRLESCEFRIAPSVSLQLHAADAGPGRVGVSLDYPEATRDVDITYRPAAASGGVVRFRVGSHLVTVRRRRGTVFSVPAPAGVPVQVADGGARDRYGNRAGLGLRLR